MCLDPTYVKLEGKDFWLVSNGKYIRGVPCILRNILTLALNFSRHENHIDTRKSAVKELTSKKKIFKS